MDFSLPDFLIFCGSTLLMAMLLMELLDWSCILAAFEYSQTRDSPNSFAYGEESGPAVWRRLYPEAQGCEQSPVNIMCRFATVLAPSEPLCWYGYADEPVSASLANDGNTIVLLGFWPRSSRPNLRGGPLCSPYDFQSAVFRWGPANDEGSEHSLDYVRYPLELQAIHTKRDQKTCSDSGVAKPKDSIAIVSYLFQITNADNPYLDHVVTNLWRVMCPGSCVNVPAFPLEWLFPSFEHKYYTYCGSLTHPPCSEIVTWIIQPEPIAISAAQIVQFRKICSTEGPILSNSRPVQKLNDREVFFYA